MGKGLLILLRENIQETLDGCRMLNACPVHVALNKQEELSWETREGRTMSGKNKIL